MWLSNVVPAKIVLRVLLTAAGKVLGDLRTISAGRPSHYNSKGPPASSLSGQRNLMKTYNNEADSSRITKIASKKNLDPFGKIRWV